MSASGNGRLEVTAWVEQPKGMTKRAIVRVGDDLYTFKEFDERPARKLGDGAMAGVVKREDALRLRELRVTGEANRLELKNEELKFLEESLRDKDEIARRERQLDGREQMLDLKEEALGRREKKIESIRTEAAADLEEASDLKASAKRELASAESSIRRAVSRERTQAEEVHQKGRAVLKHLEDKLSEVGKKEALLDRRLEAMTNLMCGNVRDFMEDFR